MDEFWEWLFGMAIRFIVPLILMLVVIGVLALAGNNGGSNETDTTHITN